MKILNDSFKVGNGLSIVRSFQELGLKAEDVEKSVTPLVIITKPDYVNRKSVGFYPSMSCMFAHLTMSGPLAFSNYVREYSEASGELKEFSEALDDKFSDSEHLAGIGSISVLVEFLKTHQVAFRELSKSLRLKRPVDLSKRVDSIQEEVDKDFNKFFVANYCAYSSEVSHDTINCLGSQFSMFGYSINNIKDIEVLKEDFDFILDRANEFDVALAFSIMSKKMSDNGQPISNTPPQARYNFIFDLVNSLYESWGI